MRPFRIILVSSQDSIPIWDAYLGPPDDQYYSKNEKFQISGGQIIAGPRLGEKAFYLKGTLLFFYDTESTADLKDDRIAVISIDGGQLNFDSYSNYYAPEGSHIWVYHDPGIKLRVLLPNDYLPAKNLIPDVVSPKTSHGIFLLSVKPEPPSVKRLPKLYCPSHTFRIIKPFDKL